MKALVCQLGQCAAQSQEVIQDISTQSPALGDSRTNDNSLLFDAIEKNNSEN